MNTSDELQNRTASIRKTFDAPVQLVWEAWTQPEHIANWWAPGGMKMKIVEHDFRVGGKWKFTMPMQDGSEFISEGEYIEILEFKKIVTSANFRPMTEGVELHILFEAAGDKTNFTFNVIHATEEYCKQQEKMGIYNGWGSAFDRLYLFVKTLLKK
jgi:uncharacterized protein YndB with AHSA1/START domain